MCINCGEGIDKIFLSLFKFCNLIYKRIVLIKKHQQVTHNKRNLRRGLVDAIRAVKAKRDRRRCGEGIEGRQRVLDEGVKQWPQSWVEHSFEVQWQEVNFVTVRLETVFIFGAAGAGGE